jgi:hypothetical protein
MDTAAGGGYDNTRPPSEDLPGVSRSDDLDLLALIDKDGPLGSASESHSVFDNMFVHPVKK